MQMWNLTKENCIQLTVNAVKAPALLVQCLSAVLSNSADLHLHVSTALNNVVQSQILLMYSYMLTTRRAPICSMRA